MHVIIKNSDVKYGGQIYREGQAYDLDGDAVKALGDNCEVIVLSKPEKPAKPEKLSKPEKPAKPEKLSKPEKPAKEGDEGPAEDNSKTSEGGDA